MGSGGGGADGGRVGGPACTQTYPHTFACSDGSDLKMLVGLLGQCAVQCRPPSSLPSEDCNLYVLFMQARCRLLRSCVHRPPWHMQMMRLQGRPVGGPGQPPAASAPAPPMAPHMASIVMQRTSALAAAAAGGLGDPCTLNAAVPAHGTLTGPRSAVNGVEARAPANGADASGTASPRSPRTPASITMYSNTSFDGDAAVRRGGMN